MWTEQRFDRALTDAFSSGKDRWPAIGCSLPQFRDWVVDGGIDADRLEANGPDIYLAACCALGDATATVVFDRLYLTFLRPLVRAAVTTDDDLKELRQQLRIKLLVGDRPKIGQYRGQGTLLGWVQACATRTALNLKRGHFHRTRSEPTMLERMVSDECNPERQLASRQSRNALSAALARCLAALSAKEKTLLQLFFVDAVSMEEIAPLFGVHRATVARWIGATRTKVLDGVCRAMSAELQATRAEVSSLMGLDRSEIDISVGTILGGGRSAFGERARPQAQAA